MVPTSQSLLERLKSQPNDELSWRRFDALYRPFIDRCIARFSILPQDRDDFVQEILLTVTRKLGHFDHNQRTGAFRCWLRQVTTNKLREAMRGKQFRFPASDRFHEMISQLEDPDSDLSRDWDLEHDRYVLGKLMDEVRSEFQPRTWQAFIRLVYEGAASETVAAELQMSTQQVYAAKHRVMGKLRTHAKGIIE